MGGCIVCQKWTGEGLHHITTIASRTFRLPDNRQLQPNLSTGKWITLIHTTLTPDNDLRVGKALVWSFVSQWHANGYTILLEGSAMDTRTRCAEIYARENRDIEEKGSTSRWGTHPGRLRSASTVLDFLNAPDFSMNALRVLLIALTTEFGTKRDL